MEQFNPFNLTGKTIFVTGASSGIGQAIAIACSKMRASVIISGRNETKLNNTLSQMLGENNKAIKGDLTKEEDTSSIVSELPALDGVVHCAGIGHRKPTKLVSAEDVDSVMNSNFKSAVLLQSALLSKKKINKSASIVFLASYAASSPSVGNALYSASKGAIISYSKCLAIELAPRLIRVNCICPGMVWTNLIFQDCVTKEQLEEAQFQYPLKRYGMPEDIAYLAIYLLSDASSWMTNSCININGGANEL